MNVKRCNRCSGGKTINVIKNGAEVSIKCPDCNGKGTRQIN